MSNSNFDKLMQMQTVLFYVSRKKLNLFEITTIEGQVGIGIKDMVLN